MWILALGWSVAGAAEPAVSVAAGGGPGGGQLFVRWSDPVGADGASWGLAGGIATVGSPLGRAEPFADDLQPGEFLLQPLLGPTVDVAVSQQVYLGFGAAVDLLAPLRAERAVKELDPSLGPEWARWAFGYPTLLVTHLLTMSQARIAVGVRPTRQVGLELGIYPSTWMVLAPQRAVRSVDAIDPVAWVDTLRPGAQVVAHF